MGSPWQIGVVLENLSRGKGIYRHDGDRVIAAVTVITAYLYIGG
jgi:hypothetical protein